MPNVKQFATEAETPVVLAAIAHVLEIHRKSPTVAACYGFNVREIEALKRVIKRAKNEK
jgi:hypothetical protein